MLYSKEETKIRRLLKALERLGVIDKLDFATWLRIEGYILK